MNDKQIKHGEAWIKRHLYSSELFHYGVKGMKWGVRRNKEELRYNRNSVTASVNRNLSGVRTKNGIA